MNKDVSKKVKRAAARWVYYFFSFLFKILPYSAIQGLIDFILPIGYYALKRMRKVDPKQAERYRQRTGE